MIKAPSPPYLGPAAHTMGDNNKPIERIVIHSTVSPCRAGQARATAAYFRSPAAGGSAHYVVDPGEVVQVVYDGVVAEHAPPNRGSIGVELCDMPGTGRGALLRWTDKDHRAMLRRAAWLVARLCLAYDVPVAFLEVADLQQRKHGITTHNNVSSAFRQSSHWDPGDWPRRQFMRMVRRRVKRLSSGKPQRGTSEATTPRGGTDARPGSQRRSEIPPRGSETPGSAS